MSEVFRVSEVPERMKPRFAGQPDHLAICFWMWALFNSVSDEDYPAFCEKVMLEIEARGFNCVRMDDGAGLIADVDGVLRGPVNWHRPVGPYQGGRQSPGEGSGLISKRLLIFCRAAEKHGIKLILSSWYYLHTHWHLEECVNAELFDRLPTVADKIRYFAAEHNRVLRLLRENGLLHVVAFVELCNEFDILKNVFAGQFVKITPEEAAEWRPLLEEAYDTMKRANPEVLFAHDSWTAWMRKELVPRNVDILNFHYYYFWSALYGMLDKVLTCERGDVEYPPEVAYFLKKDRLHYDDVVRARTRYTKLRTGYDWNQRIMLYNSLDPAKIPELERRIAETFAANRDACMQKLREGVSNVIAIRDEVLPGAPIVMGEGTSCCTSEKVLFEEHSDAFWEALEEQALFLRASGLWGSVVRTGSAPVDVSWNMRADSFRKVNELFLNGKGN